jgi:hypothetical protein
MRVRRARHTLKARAILPFARPTPRRTAHDHLDHHLLPLLKRKRGSSIVDWGVQAESQEIPC